MKYTPIIASPHNRYRLQVVTATTSCRVLRATNVDTGDKTLVIEIPDYTELQPDWKLPAYFSTIKVGPMVANRLGFVKDSGVSGPNVKDLRPKPEPKFRVVDPRDGCQHTFNKAVHAHRRAELLCEEIRNELARAYPNAAVPFSPPHIPVTEVYE